MPSTTFHQIYTAGGIDCGTASGGACDSRRAFVIGRFDRENSFAEENATVAVIGAGDFIGARDRQEVCFRRLHGLRRTAQWRQARAAGEAEIEKAGGEIRARSLDARKEEEIISFLRRRRQTRAARSLHLQHRRQRQLPDSRHHRTRVPQGVGNGLLLRLPRRSRSRAPDAAAGQGCIFFTGATATLRGGSVTRPSPVPSSACARWPRRRRANSDRRIFTSPISLSIPASTPSGYASGGSRRWGRMRSIDPDLLMPPSSVAEAYWLLYQQPRSAWTFELEIRPFGEKW